MTNSSLEKFIYSAKQVVPRPLWKGITGPYWWWYNRARHQAAAIFNPRLRRDQLRVAAMRDRHRGERCFIIGNGPSLRETDLTLLEGEVTFGMNRIYLLFREMGYSTSYYVSINTLVIEQCADEILDLEMPRFISWRGRRWLQEDPQVLFLDTDYTEPEDFAQDVSGRVFEGSTVTYVALQIAYHLGFDQAILVGVDHNFQSEGRPNTTVVSQGDDPDHFSARYFGKGFRWQLPDLEASEAAYRMAKDAFEADGRRIVDATVGGQLKVFPKVDFDQLFRK